MLEAKIPLLKSELRLVYYCNACGDKIHLSQDMRTFLMQDRKLRKPNMKCPACGGRCFVLLPDECYIYPRINVLDLSGRDLKG